MNDNLQRRNEPDEPLPLTALTHVPPDEVRAEMGRQLDTALIIRFRESLSFANRVRMENPPADWIERSEYRALLRIFDNFLLEEMKLLGWRLLLSKLVLDRIAAWTHTDPDGRQLLKQLGKELSFFSGIQRGEECFPLNEGIKRLYMAAKADLKRLLNVARNNFGQGRPPSFAAVVEWMRSEVAHERALFPTIFDESVNFFSFLDSLPGTNKDFAARLVSGDMTPSDLCIEYIARNTNRTPEALRHALSKIVIRDDL